MIRKLIIGLAILPSLVGIAGAQQHTTIINGKEFVVHSNRVPVVVHRVLPPYWNKHITVREMKSGNVPASSRR